jgi:hypothetical protein
MKSSKGEFQALKDNEIVTLCFHFPTQLKWLGFDRVDPFPLSFFHLKVKPALYF